MDNFANHDQGCGITADNKSKPPNKSIKYYLHAYCSFLRSLNVNAKT